MEYHVITTNQTVLDQKRNISFQEAYRSFCAGLRLSTRTGKAYRQGVTRFISWCAAAGIGRPTREDYSRYLDDMAVTLRPTSQNAYMAAVRRFYQFLEVYYGWDDITKHFKGAKIDRTNLKDPLTADGARSVLTVPDQNTLQGRRDFALLALLLTCGLRTIEITRANWGDLQTLLGRRVLKVQGKGKADKRDFVIIPDKTAAALEAYRDDLRPGDEDPLFQSLSHNSRGKRLTTRSLSRIVKEALIAAGYNSDRLTAHSLRHTAVTLALEGGMTIQEAQAFARHANITTTTVYAHNLDALKNQCSQTVANAVF